MAWRIDKLVVRGELDFRTRGRVVGQIRLAGSDEPLRLELKGSPWRDLAGHVLRFTNPESAAGDLEGLATLQEGVVGDITASRKIKVPTCSREEFRERYAARQPISYRWSNSLYLEWFSGDNGRVVIESASFELELDPVAAWKMSPEEETEQRLANGRALTGFMERLGMAVGTGEDVEPDEVETEKWKGEERRRPPLVERTSNLGVRVHKDVKAGGWIPDGAQPEHPVIEILSGIRAAGAKLAGALGTRREDEEWPPPALFAGDSLVRLKKAREYLRDALRGLDSADEEALATPQWRADTRREVAEILGKVQHLIAEVREVLREGKE